MATSGTSFSATNQPAKRGKRGKSKITLAQAAFARLGYSPIECQTLIAMQLKERIIEKDSKRLNFDDDLDMLIKVNSKLIEFETPRPASELDVDITTDGEALVPAKPLNSVELLAVAQVMEQRLLG